MARTMVSLWAVDRMLRTFVIYWDDVGLEKVTFGSESVRFATM